MFYANQGQAVMIRPEMNVPREMMRLLYEELNYHPPDKVTEDLDEVGRRLSDRFYRMTPCGAWLALIPAGMYDTGVKEEQTWRAKFLQHGGHAKVIRLTRIHQDGKEVSYEIYAAPREVRQYVSISPFDSEDDPYNDITRTGWTTIRDLRTGTATIEATRRFEINGTPGVEVTFRHSLPLLEEHQGGVEMASTVEGIDAETQIRSLRWPFTAEQFWNQAHHVELDANELWLDTHGCENCARLNLEYVGDDWAPGNTPVHEDCSVCGGSGIPF